MCNSGHDCFPTKSTTTTYPCEYDNNLASIDSCVPQKSPKVSQFHRIGECSIHPLAVQGCLPRFMVRAIPLPQVPKQLWRWYHEVPDAMLISQYMSLFNFCAMETIALQRVVIVLLCTLFAHREKFLRQRPPVFAFFAFCSFVHLCRGICLDLRYELFPYHKSLNNSRDGTMKF